MNSCFTFPVMTEEEIKALNLVEEGTYDFQVISASPKTSKTGNPMIKLCMKIWDAAGKEHLIWDYLVAVNSMAYKIKHFCDAVGLEKEYQTGKFDACQCEGKTGKVYILIEEGKSNGKGGLYPDKNAVRDYISNEKQGELIKEGVKAENDFPDDAIPF